MAISCFHQNIKKKLDPTEVSSASPANTTNTSKGVKDGTTQNKDVSLVKKDTASNAVSSKKVNTEYPEKTDTLKVVYSGYLLLKDEIEVLQKEVSALKIENNTFKEDVKAVKTELETLKKEKK